eukprot:Unigene9583_Nuclearia_a/m.29290 Unigene9583_Nuclearia_a/g.29290  ORF Unigene9583_Nuclearia_a/g.29290 Unigene9583_Nuclearia_a/m.29290 type:complete len:108 (+) Unigene9583_Nuclearia_a:546-869(+)
MTDEGAAAVADVLPLCTRLEKLDLEANDISRTVISKLYAKRRPQLKILRIDLPDTDELMQSDLLRRIERVGPARSASGSVAVAAAAAAAASPTSTTSPAARSCFPFF